MNYQLKVNVKVANCDIGKIEAEVIANNGVEARDTFFEFLLNNLYIVTEEVKPVTSKSSVVRIKKLED